MAVIAFAVSAPTSNLIAAKAGEFLVSRVITGTANINVQIDAVYLFPLYLIGILLIAVAVIVSSWTVVCLKPKDILIKMS